MTDIRRDWRTHEAKWSTHIRLLSGGFTVRKDLLLFACIILAFICGCLSTNRPTEAKAQTKDPYKQFEGQELRFEEIKTTGFGPFVSNCYRAKVPGGWLVAKSTNATGLTFFPDPKHKWKPALD